MLDGYAKGADKPPLLSYAAFMTIFAGLFGAGLAATGRSGRKLPLRIGPGDLALIGAASHKASRLLAKDKVTSPLRAPFTELEGRGGPAEYEERSRGRGLRKAVGELLICPYCLGLWVVAVFCFGLVFVPRVTRFVAAVLSALTISDFLQIAYKAAEDKGLS